MVWRHTRNLKRAERKKKRLSAEEMEVLTLQRDLRRQRGRVWPQPDRPLIITPTLRVNTARRGSRNGSFHNVASQLLWAAAYFILPRASEAVIV